MEIRPFEIERFYERWEFHAELMLSSSDCESLAVNDLLALEPDAEQRLHRLGLGYTEVPGSAELRRKLHAVVSLSEVEDVFASYLANPHRYDDAGVVTALSDESDELESAPAAA